MNYGILYIKSLNSNCQMFGKGFVLYLLVNWVYSVWFCVLIVLLFRNFGIYRKAWIQKLIRIFSDVSVLRNIFNSIRFISLLKFEKIYLENQQAWNIFLLVFYMFFRTVFHSYYSRFSISSLFIFFHYMGKFMFHMRLSRGNSLLMYNLNSGILPEFSTVQIPL